MTEPTHPDNSKQNPHDHGAAVSVARQAAKLHASEAADRRREERRDPTAGKHAKRLSEDEWIDVLSRVQAGEPDSNIAAYYGITPAAIVFKRHHDDEFREAYALAVEEAFISIAKDIRHVVRGVPGYSSGDVRRDELIAKYDLELAKRFARKVLGDSVKVEGAIGIAPVMLPTIALPSIPDAEFSDIDQQKPE